MDYIFDFFFQKQDHTLGHLIQAWIDENAMKNGEVTFVGYDIPHPLRDEMVLRIGVAETSENDEVVARQAVQKAMTACQAMFLGWKDMWSAVSGRLASTSSSASASASAAVSSASATPTVPVKRPILRRPTTATTPAV
jgi:DNA-directed RNA polymerase subunit L